MSKASRNRGLNLEREIAKKFRELGFDAITSRAGDRSRDANGEDILNIEPFAVQAKAGYGIAKFYKWLEDIKTNKQSYKIVWNKGKGKHSDIVAMYADDFLEIVSMLVKEGIITPNTSKFYIYDSNNL